MRTPIERLAVNIHELVTSPEGFTIGVGTGSKTIRAGSDTTIGELAQVFQETPERIMDALAVLKMQEGRPTTLPPIYWGDGADTALRRAQAALEPDRWRIGGSPGTGGHTVYQGPRLVGMVLNPDDGRAIVAAMNALEGLAPDSARVAPLGPDARSADDSKESEPNA